MKTYVLLHFEHENDVTIIIKLHRTIRLRLVALYRSLTMTSLSCSKRNRSFNGISVNYYVGMTSFEYLDCV